MSPSIINNTLVATPGRTRRERRVDILDTPLTTDRRSHSRSSVLIETSYLSNEFGPAPEVFSWSNITRGKNGADTTATLIVGALDGEKITQAETIGEEHFKHLRDDVHPDLRVRIVVKRGGGEDDVILFQGFPMVRTISWSPDHQSFSVQCIDEAQELLRTMPEQQILGRGMRIKPHVAWDESNKDVVLVGSLPIVFNPGGKPNRLAERLVNETSGGLRHTLFAFDDDDATSAKFWNVADALRYLVFTYIDQGNIEVNVEDFLEDTDEYVDLPRAASSDNPFTRKMTARVEHVSVQSMNIEQAIREVAQSVGLEFELVIKNKNGEPEHSLRVYAPIANEREESASRDLVMGAPVVRDIRRETPWGDPTSRTTQDIRSANEGQHVTLSTDSRVVNRPAFLGGAIDYEITTLLRPGWTPHSKLDNLNNPGNHIPHPAIAAYQFWEAEFGQTPEDENDVDDKPRSIYHAKHLSFPTVSDVGRLWIFPDTAQYRTGYTRSNGPYKQRMYDPFYTEVDPDLSIYSSHRLGGGLPQSVGRRMAMRARPFRNLISRHSGSETDQSPIVRFNFKSTDADRALSETLNWFDVSDAVVFDAERAALWIKEPNLLWAKSLSANPNDSDPLMNMIKAYIGLDENNNFIGPHLFVSVTYTIRDDQRMFYTPRLPRGAQIRLRTKLIDYGNQFTVRNRRGQNSHLNLQPVDSDLRYEDRDDTEKFQLYCDEQASRMGYEISSGPITIPHITTQIRMGDSFSGVSGLGIDLERFPKVVSIQYTNDQDAGFKTQIVLSDLRHNPEVGV